MCKVLNLARSGYYAWSKCKASPRTQENEILSQQIQLIHQASRETYGSPRIHAALVAKGFQVGRQRVVRLMAKLGICARPKRRFKVTTDSGYDLPIAENVLDRDFTTTEPDRGWVADKPIFGRLKDGFTWLSLSTCSQDGWWVGQWLSICVQNLS